MKKVINILLAICIVAMVYIVYGSIMGPIKFANEKGIRDKAVIQKLMDIKAAQTEYNYQNGMYCDNFDTLALFIRTAQLPITKRIGELTDDQLEHIITHIYNNPLTIKISLPKRHCKLV